MHTRRYIHLELGAWGVALRRAEHLGNRRDYFTEGRKHTADTRHCAVFADLQDVHQLSAKVPVTRLVVTRWRVLWLQIRDVRQFRLASVKSSVLYFRCVLGCGFVQQHFFLRLLCLCPHDTEVVDSLQAFREPV